MITKVQNVHIPKIDFPIKADCPICGELYVVEKGKGKNMPDGTRVMVCPNCAVIEEE